MIQDTKREGKAEELGERDGRHRVRERRRGEEVKGRGGGRGSGMRQHGKWEERRRIKRC